ncbi:MAG: YbaK/EbsC family protein [Acidiferrobacterales bacterium]|nr:YbaK/EbsC family protein [Acidiferrobacterales bacterium]
MARQASAERFRAAMQARGFAIDIIELPDSARTAPEAAHAVGCAVAQIVKSIIFRGVDSDRPILVVASGANRVDERVLGELVGEAVAKADAAFTRRHTGFAIGGVPPTGHLERLHTFVDQDLLQHEEIWAAAGTPHVLFKLTPAELQAMTGGRVAAIS